MTLPSRIAIVSSEYPPEPTVSGRMAADLVAHMASRSVAVTVICPYPSRGCPMPSRQERCGISSGERDGVRIVRVPSYLAPQSRFLPRIRESWSFGRWSVLALRREPAPDVLYSATWPMMGQAWITAAAARSGIPHVTHVMDLYPESALLKLPRTMAAVTRPPLLALDRWIARTVSQLVVISEVMRQSYIETRRIAPERIAVVSTWQDEARFATLPSRAEAAVKYGVDPGKFSFMYLGNIGPVAGVEHLIESFAAAGLPQAQLLIAGEGSNKQSCVELARQSGANIQFISDPEIANVPLLQSLADVFLLPIRKGAATSSVPSKLSAYMLSGKPVLASVDAGSETARLITDAHCGWVIDPENPNAMAAKMRECLLIQGGILGAMGTAGRAYAFSYLSKSRGLGMLADLLTRAGARARSGNRCLSDPQFVELK